MQQQTLDGILWTVDDRGIARIVMDRPAEANTMTLKASTAFAHAVDDVAAASPRVVLLTGTGRMFCAGGDIGEFQQNMGAFAKLIEGILDVLHPAVVKLGEMPVPVVVAINGSFGGAGVGLALCGDFAYAAASMKLRTGYVALGLSPDAGASYFLTRRIGAAHAKQLFLTNDALDAQQCLAAGIVDAVFPDDRVLAEAEKLCARLAQASSGSIAAIKQLCDGAERRTLTAHLALEKRLLEERARDTDAREGVTAFLERRPAMFGSRRT
ncbi:MAG: enoyl-CoA hydratase-related protein [Burkholderiaceae bacterium]